MIVHLISVTNYNNYHNNNYPVIYNNTPHLFKHIYKKQNNIIVPLETKIFLPHFSENLIKQKCILNIVILFLKIIFIFLNFKRNKFIMPLCLYSCVKVILMRGYKHVYVYVHTYDYDLLVIKNVIL